MKRIFLIIAVVCIALFSACKNENAPIQVEEKEEVTPTLENTLTDEELTAMLLGRWDNDKEMRQNTFTLIFTEDGTLDVYEMPNKNHPVVVLWGGDGRILQYKVVNGRLVISYQSTVNDAYDYSFDYTTEFSISNDVLVIDSLTYNNAVIHENLTFNKQQP